jgi:hypothetical protein
VLVCLANDSAELESREFHVSMPITQSRVTDKYLLFASSRKLYASSLLERNEGETTFEHNSELDELIANSEQEDARTLSLSRSATSAKRRLLELTAVSAVVWLYSRRCAAAKDAL